MSVVGRLNWQVVFGRVLLLYQMPKAGSQTLEATLRLCGLPHHIVRLHFLAAKNGSHIRNYIDSNTPQAWQSVALAQMKLLEETSSSLRIRKLLVRCGVRLPRIEVITAVRDVLGVALSSIFQNHQLFAETPNELTADRCREVIMRPKLCAQFQDWFDTELRPTIGLDVFKTTFPAEQGTCEYRNSLARVLLYRFDKLPCLGPVLGKFFGREIPPLQKRNVGTDKDYGEAYRTVRDCISLPVDFVNRTLDCAMMRHFYSNQERDVMRQKWAKIPTDMATDPESASGSRAVAYR